ncbi:MAG: hypothetical protein ABH837_02595 [bacterium]
MKSKNKILYYLAEELTNKFIDGIDFFEDIITYPYKGYRVKPKFKFESSYRRSFKDLIKKELIIQKKDKFYLTLKGKLELLKASSGKLQYKSPKWDGKWRIIAFDIPETKRNSRKQLREYLFYLGFKQLQKSIWIIPYKINFEDLADLFDKAVTEELVFIESSNISGEEKIKKLFDLKQ